ncbi:TIGR04282 family arsenosugar biosynthesis glycosyltransferase [Orenia marismortui]|uniref:Glycosyltransferase A (GT-A) superfamily protein (DUF2064 family) n=1 Tax=Orenia marismortui TaxID=46469 RepID=A0A4R8GU15_9FIRM|nr:TIGR04282 family arsenosugar biosynthesis glycosyltransferase [Orenia marismortui]TDX48358.1 hypothetical protein C7959_12919 [Orenia marismortui]
MSVGIVLMSRIPIPGKTKTRLQSHLSPQECAELHKAFLKDITKMLSKVSKMRQDVKLYLAYTPSGKESILESLIPKEFEFFAQEGTDLGEKMYNALDYAYEDGNGRQIIMGSDLPALQPNNILKAIDRLLQDDIVLGPSLDGGYYLMGTREPKRFLFDDLLWGKDEVLEATIELIQKESNLQYSLVDQCADIDLYQELLELYQRLLVEGNWELYPKSTAKFTKELLGSENKLGGTYLCPLTR